MLTNKNHKFNLTDEILAAAENLKEEQQLIISNEAIANIIHNWLNDELEEIEWHYQNSSKLQKEVFKAELEVENLAA